MALCPVHEREGSTPSLAIVDRDGHVLLKCHAGCAQKAVIDALKARGLWEVSTREPYRRIVAEYDYTDEHGDLLYQVVRFDPKDFRQRYPNGNGGWIWRKHERQVL